MVVPPSSTLSKGKVVFPWASLRESDAGDMGRWCSPSTGPFLFIVECRVFGRRTEEISMRLRFGIIEVWPDLIRPLDAEHFSHPDEVRE